MTLRNIYPKTKHHIKFLLFFCLCSDLKRVENCDAATARRAFRKLLQKNTTHTQAEIHSFLTK